MLLLILFIAALMHHDAQPRPRAVEAIAGAVEQVAADKPEQQPDDYG